MYLIVETLVRFLIWQFDKLDIKIIKLNTHQFKLNACVPMTLRNQVAKFKFRQYHLRAVSPNLMLTKITHYNIIHSQKIKRIATRPHAV